MRCLRGLIYGNNTIDGLRGWFEDCEAVLEKNISRNTVKEIITPLLKQKKTISEEKHYRTVLLLSDILERATDEAEAIRMITEKFPEISDIKNK